MKKKMLRLDEHTKNILAFFGFVFIAIMIIGIVIILVTWK